MHTKLSITTIYVGILYWHLSAKKDNQPMSSDRDIMVWGAEEGGVPCGTYSQPIIVWTDSSNSVIRQNRVTNLLCCYGFVLLVTFIIRYILDRLNGLN